MDPPLKKKIKNFGSVQFLEGQTKPYLHFAYCHLKLKGFNFTGQRKGGPLLQGALLCFQTSTFVRFAKATSTKCLPTTTSTPAVPDIRTISTATSTINPPEPAMTRSGERCQQLLNSLDK